MNKVITEEIKDAYIIECQYILNEYRELLEKIKTLSEDGEIDLDFHLDGIDIFSDHAHLESFAHRNFNFFFETGKKYHENDLDAHMEWKGKRLEELDAFLTGGA